MSETVIPKPHKPAVKYFNNQATSVNLYKTNTENTSTHEDTKPHEIELLSKQPESHKKEEQ